MPNAIRPTDLGLNPGPETIPAGPRQPPGHGGALRTHNSRVRRAQVYVGERLSLGGGLWVTFYFLPFTLLHFLVFL